MKALKKLAWSRKRTVKISLLRNVTVIMSLKLYRPKLPHMKIGHKPIPVAELSQYENHPGPLLLLSTDRLPGRFVPIYRYRFVPRYLVQPLGIVDRGQVLVRWTKGQYEFVRSQWLVFQIQIAKRYVCKFVKLYFFLRMRGTVGKISYKWFVLVKFLTSWDILKIQLPTDRLWLQEVFKGI